MRHSEIEHARDVYSELVVALTLQKAPPTDSEAAELARKALGMAVTFQTAQDRLAAAPVVGRKPQASAGTFSHVAQKWIERAVKRTAGGSRRDLLSRFNRFVFPHLGARPINDIEPVEILSVVRAIENTGHTRMAYLTFSDIRFLFRYALAAGLTKSDPTAGLRRAIARPQRKGTYMLLDPDSIGLLLRAIRNYQGKPHSTARYMMRLMPLVFLRASELRTLEWSDVDLDVATIVIPASRMKMRRLHVVPLARQAVAILRDVHQMTGGGRFLFSSGRGVDKPFDYSIFHVILGTLGYRKRVSAQGFRVLASTWLNERGWSSEVIERQLSHLGSDRVRRIYNHAEYLAQRRRMMQDWADHLESLERKAGLPLKAISRPHW